MDFQLWISYEKYKTMFQVELLVTCTVNSGFNDIPDVTIHSGSPCRSDYILFYFFITIFGCNDKIIGVLWVLLQVEFTGILSLQSSMFNTKDSWNITAADIIVIADVYKTLYFLTVCREATLWKYIPPGIPYCSFHISLSKAFWW